MKIYIHIGPFKTGTTDFQEYMWRHRLEYASQGVLYPKTGVVSRNWGHRHLKLAHCKEINLWDSLAKEINESLSVEKVIISSERFWLTLPKTIPLIKSKLYMGDVELVVAVRNESDLARSLYLQTVKSRLLLMKKKGSRGIASFDEWFVNNAQRLCYPSILKDWIEEFGESSIKFVPYIHQSKFDVIEEICNVLGIQLYSEPSRVRANSSIGGFSAKWALRGLRLGPLASHYLIRFFFWLERLFPALSKSYPNGYDLVKVNSYYALCRERYAGKYPVLDKYLGMVNNSR
jgi:hypothetical protein